MVNVFIRRTINNIKGTINQMEVKRMSRPKKEKEIVKCKVLQARITESEYDLYNQKAQELGMNISTLIRMSLINFLKDK